LTVTGINDAPTARDDTYDPINADGLLVTTTTNGLLANDTDPDNGTQPLQIDITRSDSVSAGGALVNLRPDGTFHYQPSQAFADLPEGASFDDTFSYMVVDAQGATSLATAHIRVLGVNDPPHAPDYTVAQGYWATPNQILRVPLDKGVLIRATDPDQ